MLARRATTYTVCVQKPQQAFQLLIRHPKSGWNYQLAERPKGTEDLADGYLVPLAVAKGKVESRTLRQPLHKYVNAKGERRVSVKEGGMAAETGSVGVTTDSFNTALIG